MRSRHDRLVVAHAVFACLAGLIVVPAALLIGRYRRANPQWWRMHALLNVLGALLIIIAFALGMASSGPSIGGDDSDLHHRLGLGVFLLFLLQLVFGFVAHYVFRPSQSRLDEAKSTANTSVSASFAHWQRLSRAARSFRAWHISVGIVTMGLLYWQMWNGIHTEWNSMSDDGSKTPQSVEVLYWIIVCAPLAAYLFNAGTESLQAAEKQPLMLS